MTTDKTHWGGVALGVGLASFAAYQQFKLPPVLPEMLQLYDYPRTLAGGFMSVYALVGLLFSFAIGKGAERRGLLGAVFVGLALGVLGNLVSLAAPADGWIMLAGRALEGLAFAIFAVVGPALASRSASPRHLPIVIGLISSWIPIGQLTATGLAPLALEAGDWRYLWLGALALAGVMAALTLLARRGDPGLFRPTRHDSGARTASSRSERWSLAINGSLFLLWSGQYFAYMTWLPQYLVEVQGLAMGGAMLGYALPVAVLLVFNILTGLALKAGVPLGGLLVGALIPQAASWWVIPYLGADAFGVAALVVYGMTAGITPTCLWALPSAILGQARASAGAFGIVMTGRNLGVLAGPVVLAWLVEEWQSWDVVARVFGTTTTLALALGLAIAIRLAIQGTRR